MMRALAFALLVSLGAALDAVAHEHTAPWLDPTKLDSGLYVELRHPRVLRRPGDFDLAVVVNNLDGRGEVVVREMRYRLPGAFDATVHRFDTLLASRRAPFRRYQSVRQRLHRAVEEGDRAAAERLGRQNHLLLRAITNGTLRDAIWVGASFVPDVGRTLTISVEIDVLEPGGARTLVRTVDIPVAPPLPSGTDGSWFAGDQHLHTAYSIDAFLVNRTRERVADYARTAQSLGLDWIIVSDHSNLGFLVWYKPYLFRLGELEARRFREREDYLVLQGQETGVGANGRLGQPAHVLAYPFASDSTGFLLNPCPGFIFDFVNCEPEQVVLDRINDAGGLGFIAHPFDSSLAFAAWNPESGASGWAGLEIFNSYAGSFANNDRQSVDWWHELLLEIDPPRDGELAARPGFPTRFPVGLGSSDAHETGRIGSVFSYCRLPEVDRGYGLVPREDLMQAFVSGRCVASNGPLVYGEIQGAGTGEVAIVPRERGSLAVTLQTTSELGPVAAYEVIIYVDGAPRTMVPFAEAPGYEATVTLENLLSPPDRFVTLETRSVSGAYVAIANPIWLEFENEVSR